MTDAEVFKIFPVPGWTTKCGLRTWLPKKERIHNYVELGRDVRNGADRGFIEGTVYACQVCGMDKFKRDREMHP
jgi:hypothetical protein